VWQLELQRHRDALPGEDIGLIEAQLQRPKPVAAGLNVVRHREVVVDVLRAYRDW
jgi:hypothetical protein